MIRSENTEICAVEVFIPLVRFEKYQGYYCLDLIAENEVVRISTEILHSLDPESTWSDLETQLSTDGVFVTGYIEPHRLPLPLLIGSDSVKINLEFVVWNDPRFEGLYFIGILISKTDKALEPGNVMHFMDYCSKIASKYSLHHPCEIHVSQVTRTSHKESLRNQKICAICFCEV